MVGKRGTERQMVQSVAICNLLEDKKYSNAQWKECIMLARKLWVQVLSVSETCGTETCCTKTRQRKAFCCSIYSVDMMSFISFHWHCRAFSFYLQHRQLIALLGWHQGFGLVKTKWNAATINDIHSTCVLSAMTCQSVWCRSNCGPVTPHTTLAEVDYWLQPWPLFSKDVVSIIK